MLQERVHSNFLAIVWRIIGAVGLITCITIYALHPSFPTPDKLLLVIIFAGMMFSQGFAVIKRFTPFVAMLLVYESFRGIVPHLNTRVNFMFMPNADRVMFGTLPTQWLQGLLWHGHVQWYDFVFYGAYTLHFVLPFAVAVLVWKLRPKQYWRYITTFITVSFFGFLTFLAFPAAPPWMASNRGYIPNVSRVSSSVWSAMGIQDFPSVYDKISPNPVAAVPSLHAAYATLLALFVWKLFGKRWGLLAAIYPLLIYVGTVYMGEHYAIDEILGGLYALGAYQAVVYLTARVRGYQKRRLLQLQLNNQE